LDSGEDSAGEVDQHDIIERRWTRRRIAEEQEDKKEEDPLVIIRRLSNYLVTIRNLSL
jgi:hypothetical protein